MDLNWYFVSILFGRPSMFSKNMVFPRAQSFCPTYSALHKQPKPLSLHFQPWKYLHPNWIRWRQIILVNDTLAPIKYYMWIWTDSIYHLIDCILIKFHIDISFIWNNDMYFGVCNYVFHHGMLIKSLLIVTSISRIVCPV